MTDVSPMSARARLRRMATWSRAVKLFQDFRVEQTDPDRFYGTMAADSVAQLACLADLRGAHVLDVGGGPGYWAEEFERAGAAYTPLDADVGSSPCTAGFRCRARSSETGRRCPSAMRRSTSCIRAMSPSTFRIRGGWATRWSVCVVRAG